MCGVSWCAYCQRLVRRRDLSPTFVLFFECTSRNAEFVRDFARTEIWGGAATPPYLPPASSVPPGGSFDRTRRGQTLFARSNELKWLERRFVRPHRCNCRGLNATMLLPLPDFRCNDVRDNKGN